MNLIERVSAILLKPKETWPVIEAEPATVAGLYKNYIALLACIPAVAGFIGMSLVGVSGFVTFRVPLVTGLVNMVVSYVLSLVMVYVLALIVNALAPKFSGQPNSINALKLVGYGLTAGFLGGIFSIGMLLPSLGVSVRRLHDIDRSGWWLLIALVPVVGAIVLLVFCVRDSQPGTNRFGPNPKDAMPGDRFSLT